MTTQPPEQTPEASLTADAIVERLDAIMHELQTLRQALLASQPQPSSSIVDQLWGSLGHGAPEELQAYDDDIYDDIYIEMFSDESAG